MRRRPGAGCAASAAAAGAILFAAPLHLWSGLQGAGGALTRAPRALSPACDFFFGAGKFDDACNATAARAAAARATAEGRCLPPDAYRPTELLFHMWSVGLPWDDADAMRWALLPLKAWALTQNLRRSRLILWTSAADVAAFNSSRNGTALLAPLAPHVRLEVFDYAAQIEGTPLALSAHFRNWSALEEGMSSGKVGLSDVVRGVLLHNHGGVWLDGDASPLCDLWNITVGVGAQLMPKWDGGGGFSNSHILCVARPRSALARRRLTHLAMFPLAHRAAWPRQPQTRRVDWVFNDAAPEHMVRAANPASAAAPPPPAPRRLTRPLLLPWSAARGPGAGARPAARRGLDPGRGGAAGGGVGRPRGGDAARLV
jgi:hypothetical protein